MAKLEEEYEEVVEVFAKEHLKDIQNSANVALIIDNNNSFFIKKQVIASLTFGKSFCLLFGWNYFENYFDLYRDCPIFYLNLMKCLRIFKVWDKSTD